MENQLHALETKLTQLITISTQLRAENHQLRQALAHAQSLNRVMSDNMNVASSRLESILLNLPDDLP
ncbi:MAG: hypothetical protein RL358_628 [Pseudomonadota bacterium]|jgi:cell division protein ZapB